MGQTVLSSFIQSTVVGHCKRRTLYTASQNTLLCFSLVLCCTVSILHWLLMYSVWLIEILISHFLCCCAYSLLTNGKKNFCFIF